MGSHGLASNRGGHDMRTLVLFLALVAKAIAGPFGFGLPDIGGVPSSHVPTDVLSLSHFAAASKDSPKSPSLTRQAPPGSKVCLTKGCVKAAADLINSMDETVDPCSDFYNFACGNFIKETVIPDHQTSYGSFSIVRDKLNLRLRKLFEGKPGGNDPQAYQIVRNYFQACMDTESIEEKSVEHLKALLDDIGGWPVLLGEKWQAKAGASTNWHELSMKASDKGFSSDRMISIGISTDDKDSTRRILEVDQPSLGLSREYLIKGAEMTLPREERRNKTALYNTMTIKEASALYPELPWVEYINVILSPDRTVTVEENEVVNVAVPKYIEEFGKLIATVPARTIANLIMWMNVKSSMSYLSEEAIQIQLAYSKAITGKASKSPRWEKCVKATAGLGGNYFYHYEGSLTNAVGAMYAKEYFQAAAKEVTDEMVFNIRKEFKDMLAGLDWMDAKTKERAFEKADLMTPNIAYAKEILDNRLLEEFYDGLVLSKASYLKNYLHLKIWISKYYAKEFRQPVDKKSWKTHGGAAIVNAFYNPAENSINFPAGILDGVFFQEDRPLYMNYGAIGFVVGHGITHGFDDQGSQKDGEGNLVDWWEPETKTRYLEKARCIIEQYGNYTVEVEGETLNVNGINSQGENIADNGGVKEALLAYNRLTERHGVEPILPGMNFSPRQLFWLSSARVWCNAKRPGALKKQVLTDPHSPAQFRVNGPLANLQEFSQDWGCPVGSPMNPAKKCQVW